MLQMKPFLHKFCVLLHMQIRAAITEISFFGEGSLNISDKSLKKVSIPRFSGSAVHISPFPK